MRYGNVTVCPRCGTFTTVLHKHLSRERCNEHFLTKHEKEDKKMKQRKEGKKR